MKNLSTIIATLATIAFMNVVTAPAFSASMNMSKTVSVGNLSISDVWSRSSAGMKKAGAAFMIITNSGAIDDRLIAASTPAAKKTELHTHLMEEGVMKMRQVKHIDVAAGGTTELKPGGLHVMMFKLTDVFKKGENYPLTLTFEKAGQVTVMVHIGKAGSMGGMNHQDHMKHNCMEMQGDMKTKCMEKSGGSNN